MQTFGADVSFNPSKLAMALYLSVEQYKDSRYTALVEVQTKVRWSRLVPHTSQLDSCISQPVPLGQA